MGKSNSKVLPLLSIPWRSHIRWTPQSRAQLLGDIYNFKVKGGIQYLNCLLLGQAASGKTSFFNTCSTALKDEGRITHHLTVLKPTGRGVTRKIETHPLYTKEDKVVKLRIYDCRGLHDIRGVTAEDIRLIVDGHIKHGYRINPVSPISRSDPHYRENPGLGDMMHCVVYVINAENPTEALTSDYTESIFTEIRESLIERHVPQLVLMNKADRLRSSLVDDVSDIFRSTEVKKKLEAIASFMNLPDMHVLPMANYHTEPTPNTNKDILALTNLKCIMDFANDFAHNAGAKDIPSDFHD